MFTIDAALLRPEAISPETRAFVADLEAKLAEFPATYEVPVELTRQAREDGKGIFPLDGPLEGSEWKDYAPGARRVRISLPEGAPKGVFLHIHGGGWTLGSPKFSDGQNQRLAKATGAAVISIEYRLSPEHPFPAGPDDCFAAAKWALETLPFGDLPHVIGGESAGGHLSAVTLLRLREAGLLGRMKGAALTYGCYDMRGVASLRNWGERKLVLTTKTVEWFAEISATPAQRDDPAFSPILADLSGMPPAMFFAGTEDPLLDDTLQMAPRWAATGARSEVKIYPGGIHAFDNFRDLKIAQDYEADRIAFVSACFAS